MLREREIERGWNWKEMGDDESWNQNGEGGGGRVAM